MHDPPAVDRHRLQGFQPGARMKVLLSIGAMLLVAGLALFLMRHALDPGCQIPVGREEMITPGDPATRPAPTTVPSTTPGRRRQPESPDTVHPGIPRNEHLHLRVIAEEDGRPVPGAEVAWLCDDADISWLLATTSEASPISTEDVAFDSGHKLTADAQGMVSIPRLPWRILVAARHGDFRGSATFTPWQPSPAQLPLAGGRQVTIQVVDPGGRPQAGIPVVLLAGEGAYSEVLWQGVTQGPGGQAVARFRPDSIFQGPRDFAAAFQFPITGGPPVPVDLEQPSSVRLTLPPTGRIVVRILDVDGGLFRRRAHVRLEQAGEDDLPIWEGHGRSHVETDTQDGMAVFPQVGLGLRWRVNARALDQERIWHDDALPVAGPTTSDELIQVTLKGTPAPGLLRARMVDEQGRPIPGLLVCAWIDRILEDGPTLSCANSPRVLETDPEGRLALRGPADTNAAGALIRLTGWKRTGPGGQPLGPWATFIVKPPFPPEGKDLGDVVLVGEVPVVAGKVRNLGGEPVAGARVKLARHPPGRRGPSGGPEPQWWTGLADAEGRFLFAVHETGPLMVSASKGLLEAELAQPVLPGTQDLEIVLGDGTLGSLEARLLLDPGIQWEELTVLIWRDARPSLPSLHQESGMVRSSMEALVPGLYTLRVELFGQALAKVERIEVRAGEATRDPRVWPLDLRGRIRILRLEAKTAGGKPMCELCCAGESTAGVLGPATFRGTLAGRFEIQAPSGCARFAVGWEGFRPVTLSWAPEEQRVILRAGPRVRLRYDLAAARAQAGHGLAGLVGLRLNYLRMGKPVPEPEESILAHTGGDSESSTSTPLKSAEHLLLLPMPGPYRFLLEAEVQGERRSVTVALPRSSPGVVVVEDREGEQVIELALDMAELLDVVRNAARE